jgi:Spy/CpxP family protein refolding chaperone
MSHLRFAAVCATLCIMAAIPLRGQDASATKPASSPIRSGYNPARRVPNYFGQIGLTPEQREQIYAIKAKHLDKIEALKQQIAQIERDMMTECEGVLTDVQKDLLMQRREAAKVARGKNSTPNDK